MNIVVHIWVQYTKNLFNNSWIMFFHLIFMFQYTKLRNKKILSLQPPKNINIFVDIRDRCIDFFFDFFLIILISFINTHLCSMVASVGLFDLVQFKPFQICTHKCMYKYVRYVHTLCLCKFIANNRIRNVQNKMEIQFIFWEKSKTFHS